MEDTTTDLFVKFLRNYYREDVAELAQRYPSEQETLWIEAEELYRFNADLHDDWLDQPEQVQAHAEEALTQVELPADQPLTGAHVRLIDTNGSYIPRYRVGDLGEDQLGEYIGITCQVGKVSERKPRLEEGVFECERCPTTIRVSQSWTETQEPHECHGCERQGPFSLDPKESEWKDQRKIKIQAPPEESDGGEVIGFCLGDVADARDGKLHDKAGSRATVFGRLEADMSSLFGRGNNEPVADEYFVVEGFSWGRDDDSGEVDKDEHRAAVQEVVNNGNAIETFTENIDPSLVITEQWESAIEMATAWLFAAPRIDPEEGDTVRGDIHMLFVSDPGMNKSAFAEKLAELSPQCVMKDSEGMSSDVSMTAAATQGGFGDDSWTIEPGALPKANGGHLVLDEIDKGPNGFLDGVHSPLEGSQTLEVEKAGQEATLSTRCGFLALGNPTDGTFDEYEPIPEQVDLHPALMSRFDLIATMADQPDEDVDDSVAGGVLDSIDESSRIEYGDLDAADADSVSGSVDRDVMKAWVKIAREEINPLITPEAKQQLRDFYVDTRQLNDSDTTPATARTLVAGWRLSAAFARVELSERIEPRHAKRAIKLSQQVVGLNWDSATGEFDSNRTTEAPSSQEERRKHILEAADNSSIDEIAEKTGLKPNLVEKEVEALCNKGAMYEPQTGEYRAT